MTRIKRYTLVLEGIKEERYLFYGEKIEDLYDKINDVNSKKSNSYFIGDLSFNVQRRVLNFRRYYKISKPKTLSEIDNEYGSLENEDRLKQILNINSKGRIFISYKVNKRIKLLNVFYNNRVKTLDRYYLETKFRQYGRDIKFLKMLVENRYISSNIVTRSQYEVLFSSFCILKITKDPDTFNIRPVMEFFYSFISPKGVFSYYNLRFLANLVNEYESTLKRPKEISSSVEVEYKNYLDSLYKDQIPGQMMIDGYEVGYFKEQFEDMKLSSNERDNVLKRIFRK